MPPEEDLPDRRMLPAPKGSLMAARGLAERTLVDRSSRAPVTGLHRAAPGVRTIADAIASAPDGAVIEIAPGLYAESIVIRDRRLHLRAGPPGSAVVDAGARPAITVLGGAVVIEGLGLEGRGTSGLAGPGVDVTIRDRTARLPPSGSLVINGGDHRVEDTRIAEGVWLAGGTATLRGCSLDAHAIAAAGRLVVENGSFGSGAGVRVMSSAGSVHARDSGAHQVTVHGGSATVEGGVLDQPSFIHDGTARFVDVEVRGDGWISVGAAEFVLEHATRMAGHGLVIARRGSRVKVTGSLINECVAPFLAEEGDAAIKVSDCSVHGSDGVVRAAGEGARVEFARNRVEACRGSVVHLGDGARGELTGNTIAGTDGTAIVGEGGGTRLAMRANRVTGRVAATAWPPTDEDRLADDEVVVRDRAVVVRDGAVATLDADTFSDLRAGVWVGGAGSHARLRAVALERILGSGCDAADGAEVDLAACRIERAIVAAQSWGGAALRVSDSIVRHAELGIAASSGGTLEARGNTLVEAHVLLSESRSGIVQHNRLSGGVISAVSFSEVLVADNDISHPRRAGIDLAWTVARVLRNVIREGLGDGIEVTDRSDVLLEGNAVIHCRGRAVAVRDSRVQELGTISRDNEGVVPKDWTDF